jgi:hypothetical protein
MRVVLAVGLLAGCAQGSIALSGSDATTNDQHDAAADSVVVTRDAFVPLDGRLPLDAAVDGPPDSFVFKDAPPPPPPDACVPTVTELLVNPVFDLSPTGVGWTQQQIQNVAGGPYPLITSSQLPAQSAPFYVFLGGITGEDAGAETATDQIFQDVAVPALTTQLVLTGFYIVGTTETGSVVFDTATLDLIQTNGTPIENVMSLNNTTTTPGTDWATFAHTFTANLSGQTVRLRATSTNDITNNSDFFFDTFSLKATHGCP